MKDLLYLVAKNDFYYTVRQFFSPLGFLYFRGRIHRVMLLAVDIGNSDIVFGFWKVGEWVAQMRHSSAEYTSAGTALKAWALENKVRLHEVSRLVISSVVPGVTPSLQASLRNYCGIEPLLVGMDLYAKLPISVDNPEEIGSDLVANAYAAFHRFQQKCIIVDFGTALTFTAVSDKGEIMGVAIAPGLKTAMKALFANTAQLPMVPLDIPSSVIGKNTAHALQAGILRGYIGLVNEMLDQMGKEMGGEVKIIATGGLSNILVPLHPRFDQIDRTLTLEGLRLIGEEFG